MYKYKRRAGFAALGVALVVSPLIAACGGSAGAGDDKTLRVCTGAADTVPYASKIDGEFKKQTGYDIQWIPGSSPDCLAKLVAAKGGPAPFDVIQGDDTTQYRAAQAGIIAKLDYAKQLPNYDQFVDGSFGIPGYGPAYYDIRLGVCYNTDAFAQAGVPAPSSIESWADPKLDGKIAFPDSQNFYWNTLMPGLAKYYNVPLDAPRGVIDKIKALKPQTLFSSSADGQQRLQSGEAWLTYLTDGRCLGLKLGGAKADLAPMNIKVDGKTYPYLGLRDTFDVVAGIGDAKTKAALTMIDLYTGPNGGAMAYAEKTGYITARKDTLAAEAKDPKLAPIVAGFKESDMYFPDYASFGKVIGAWTDEWNSVMG